MNLNFDILKSLDDLNSGAVIMLDIAYNDGYMYEHGSLYHIAYVTCKISWYREMKIFMKSIERVISLCSHWPTRSQVTSI